MILSFTVPLPIILSLLATQSMAQTCYYGLLDPNSSAAANGGTCPRSRNNRNLYFCGPTGASVEIKPAHPKADIILHAGFVDATMMVTCQGAWASNELYEELIAVNTGHLATLSQNAGPPNVAVSSVTLLAGGLDLWWNHYLERKQTSWNAGREVDRRHANRIAEFMTRSQSTKPWIDTFGDLLDATLLHEFSHVFEAGSSEDTEELNSYGWDNALDIRRSDNAGQSQRLSFAILPDEQVENLMFFATAAKLVTLGYELREDGSWDNLNQDPNSARPARGRSML
ncbi:hypothetical protein Vi05172_g3532 [Venturia inaequalis]|nr:hypothetical protein Vi05172_g3532 [Venturia inaequalis]